MDRQATCRQRRVIIVHTLDDARAALAAAADLGVPVALRSALGATAYMGAPLFREIAAAALAEAPHVDAVFVLDCGEDPGFALAALRQGVKRIRVDTSPDVRARLADIAGRLGAALDDNSEPALDLLDRSNPLEICRKWLSEGQ